jgi:hypothetical protein
MARAATSASATARTACAPGSTSAPKNAIAAARLNFSPGAGSKGRTSAPSESSAMASASGSVSAPPASVAAASEARARPVTPIADAGIQLVAWRVWTAGRLTLLVGAGGARERVV